MNEQELMTALEGRASEVHPAGPPTGAMIGRAAVARQRRTAFSVVAAAAAVAVVATTISLVGVGGDRSTAPQVVSPTGGGAGFAEALALLPADTSDLYFNDQAAAAGRLGLEASSVAEYNAELLDYVLADDGDGAPDPGGLFGPTTAYFERMAELPFNEYGVRWSLEGTSGDAFTYFTVYKMKPDVDLDAIVDDLVAAGLEEQELLGRRRAFTESVTSVVGPDQTIGDGYPIEFLDVTIDPEADLVILGRLSERILQVLDGELESAATAGTFDLLVGSIEDVEVASLSTEALCGRKSIVPAGLRKPAQAGHLVHGDDAALAARLVFADADTAAADLEARTAYLAGGPIGKDEEPLETYGTYDLTRDGRVVDVRLGDMGSRTLRDLTSDPGILSC
ncbi:hypothetical protein [Nocardioides sp.]|uniref:hypothetical protein n=1 Tax=Nocardioides sp. TaxID=35761 RepID=UPI002B2652BC|nr:hypothetical protein [Nocardioides sp.]